METKRVLVVDDDQGLHTVLRPALEKAGFEVYSAMTGEQGLESAADNHPDIILLDVILPGIKGREVCERLKADEKTKSIPVLFLTAKNSPDDIEAELKVGAVGHLTKPIDSQHLISEINLALT